MAHKKGVGSSKNGRDSEAQRLGVKKFGGDWASKNSAAKLLKPAIFLFVKEEQNSSPVTMSASAQMIRCLH